LNDAEDAVHNAALSLVIFYVPNSLGAIVVEFSVPALSVTPVASSLPTFIKETCKVYVSPVLEICAPVVRTRGRSARVLIL